MIVFFGGGRGMFGGNGVWGSPCGMVWGWFGVCKHFWRRHCGALKDRSLACFLIVWGCCWLVFGAVSAVFGVVLSGTEAANLNWESGDSESCDSKVGAKAALSINRLRFRLAILNRSCAIRFCCGSTHFRAARCGNSGDSWPAIVAISGLFPTSNPQSLLILLSEPGSERKVLTKETWSSLLRERKFWKLLWEQFLRRRSSP